MPQKQHKHTAGAIISFLRILSCSNNIRFFRLDSICSAFGLYYHVCCQKRLKPQRKTKWCDERSLNTADMSRLCRTKISDYIVLHFRLNVNSNLLHLPEYALYSACYILAKGSRLLAAHAFCKHCYTFFIPQRSDNCVGLAHCYLTLCRTAKF